MTKRKSSGAPGKLRGERMEKSGRLFVTLPAELLAILHRQSDKTGLAVGALARAAIERGLAIDADDSDLAAHAYIFRLHTKAAAALARSATQMLVTACDKLDQSQERATTPWSQETLKQAISDEARALRVAEAQKDVKPIPTMAEVRAQLLDQLTDAEVDAIIQWQGRRLGRALDVELLKRKRAKAEKGPERNA